MSIETRHPLPSSLHALAALAGLLERLEHAPSSASAEQYRSVAQQVSALLAQAEPGPALHQLLAAAPATAEVYENLRYDVAGLCLTPLQQALDAEMAAARAIASARKRAPKPPTVPT